MSTLSPTTILESAARPKVMPKSRRKMAPRAEKPIRVSPCSPVGSTPRNSTSNSAGPVTISPLTSLNVPRTLLIRCRAAKATVCAGSIVQVPAVQPASADGSALLTLAALLMFPPCFPPSPRVAAVPSTRTGSRRLPAVPWLRARDRRSPRSSRMVSRQPSPRAPDAVSQVHHARALQSPNQFEFDVVGAKRVEQTPPSAEQDRHEMDLHLVEQPSPQQRLRHAGTVHHHGAIARRGPGLLSAIFDVGDELRTARRNISVVDAMS